MQGIYYGKMSGQLYHPILGKDIREELPQKVRAEPSPRAGRNWVIWRHKKDTLHLSTVWEGGVEDEVRKTVKYQICRFISMRKKWRYYPKCKGKSWKDSEQRMI